MPPAAGRKATQCDVCKKKKQKCWSGASGCLRSAGGGSGEPALATSTAASALPVSGTSKVPDRFTYTHSTHKGMNSEKAAQTRRNTKRKEQSSSIRQKSAQKKQMPAPAPSKKATTAPSQKVTLASFFCRPHSKQQVQLAKAVASAMRVATKVQQAEEATPKKRGGNHIDKVPVKKLRYVLSKGHSAEQCRKMIDTFKPVQDARLK